MLFVLISEVRFKDHFELGIQYFTDTTKPVTRPPASSRVKVLELELLPFPVTVVQLHKREGSSHSQSKQLLHHQFCFCVVEAAAC